MSKRNLHPNKEIERAIQYAEHKGWRYKKAGNSAHAWGRLLCPQAMRDGCSMSVWSTPRNPDIHAQQIRRWINSCPHNNGDNNDAVYTEDLSIYACA